MTSAQSALSLLLLALVVLAVATDRRAAAREAAAARAFPPEGRFVTVDGRRVHAVVTGSGPDLVLIHGANGGTRDFTTALAPMLAGRYRVIVFDRPGLGHSDSLGDAGLDPAAQAAHLRKAAERLGADRPIVLGQSYGGAVAMAWALDAPDAVRGVVIVAGATMPWPGRGLGWWYEVAANPLARWTAVPLVAAWYPYPAAKAAIDGVFRPEAAPEGYADRIGVPLILRRAAIRDNARQVGALKRFVTAMKDRYPTLSLPVELIHGTEDRIVWAVVHAVPLARLLPDATLTLIPGAGHMPQHLHPGLVAAAVDRIAAR